MTRGDNSPHRYDSTHGPYPGEVEVSDGKLVIDGHAITISNEKEPSDIPWADAGVDYVVESTGMFISKDKASAHIKVSGCGLRSTIWSTGSLS